MRYITLLAIFATAFAAPASEYQVVIDTPATYNEHEGNSPHVEVNVYLNGVEKEAPVFATSSAFRCYYCGNQATNDLRTTAVCQTAEGKIKACGSKEDGVGCVNSKFTQEQFAKQCGIVGCISAVKTCSSSSKPKNQEETLVSEANDPGRRCFDCGNQATTDRKTGEACQAVGGTTKLCGSKGPMSCVGSKFTDEQFGTECGKVGCTSATKTCPSKAFTQEETSIFDESQTTPVEVKIYVNEL